MGFLKRINIFTLLLIIAVFAFVMRIVDIAQFPAQVSVAESKAPEKSFEPVKEAASHEAAPPSKEALEHAGEKKKAEAASEEQATPPVSSPVVDQGFSAAEVETLQSLSKRREDLDKRERQVAQKEALLKAAGSEVDRKIAELNKIKSELEDLLGKQKSAEDEQINSLVKIYENMKPKDAANIFNTLDMDVLLPVIGKISERKSSPILAAMNPEKAREVTMKLAERRKLPGLPDGDKKDKDKNEASKP